MSAAKPAKRVRRSPEELRAEAMAAARSLILEGGEQVLTMKAVAEATRIADSPNAASIECANRPAVAPNIAAKPRARPPLIV